MGLYLSKDKVPEESPNQTLQKNENGIFTPPTTPILVAKSFNPFSLLGPKDPRSPSVNIARTPLIFANRTQSLNDLNQTPNTSLTEAKLLNLGLDPRSPTTEFTRTPIIVIEKTEKPRNKKLDNVRNIHLQTTPILTRRPCSKSDIKPVPPKLLESSPITAPIINKRKSFVGLLETNIDFTETDLDDAIRSKEILNKTLPDRVSEERFSPVSNKIKQQMERLNKCNENDSSDDFLLAKKMDGKNVEQIKIGGSFEINSDTKIQKKLEPKVYNLETTIDENFEKRIIENINTNTENDFAKKLETNFETKTVACLETKTEKDFETKTENDFDLPKIQIIDTDVQETREPKTELVNLTAQVHNLDRKLTNLIFEDEEIPNDNLDLIKGNKTKEGCRTPLGIRNRNSNAKDAKKSASKLKVSDKPRNSRIPVLKSSKIQCENTPPMLDGTKKVKRSQWDSDKTLLI